MRQTGVSGFPLESWRPLRGRVNIISVFVLMPTSDVQDCPEANIAGHVPWTPAPGAVPCYVPKTKKVTRWQYNTSGTGIAVNYHIGAGFTPNVWLLKILYAIYKAVISCIKSSCVGPVPWTQFVLDSSINFFAPHFDHLLFSHHGRHGRN